ncbi:unnamed protein product [Cylicostephanus goldi]|uniref:GTP cyclohydrolase 1 feedback regulatory protein n=1 Tax=Cylicostephanus goldi TaxID=71465 RepID=A0A3P7MRH3_CYLGO|nr:unnamed protein product [Cylicostephanus goldi]
MPYMLVCSQIPIEDGPTTIGNIDIDSALAERLEAQPSRMFFTITYLTNLGPQVVLNILEREGWKVIGVAGTGNACIWTLHRQ